MRRTAWIGVGLFLIALVVFRASPRGQLYDSRFTLLVAHRIVTSGQLALDPFVDELGGVDDTGRPRDYRLVAAGGRIHWLYPPGTPLLTAPLVGVADAFGLGPVDAAGRYDRDAERRGQRWLAALAMATAGIVFFGIALAVLPPRRAAIVAAAGLFASPVFSTASRSLWSQTLALLLVGAALWLLVRGLRSGTSIRPIALASALAWAWLCRPTAAVPALLVTIFVAWQRRDALRPLLATGAIWLGAFAVFFRVVYGSWLPPYYQLGTHAFEPIPEALLGNWISPARGLLVYCPVVAVIALLAGARRQTLPERPLAALAAGGVILHWLLVSFHAPWWGGYGYGPRLMTDTVPWLVVLGALAWAAPPVRAPRHPRLGTAAAATLLAISVLMNGIGAISRAAADWNHHQAEPDFSERLWRVGDAPFLAPLREPRD